MWFTDWVCPVTLQHFPWTFTRHMPQIIPKDLVLLSVANYNKKWLLTFDILLFSYDISKLNVRVWSCPFTKPVCHLLIFTHFTQRAVNQEIIFALKVKCPKPLLNFFSLRCHFAETKSVKKDRNILHPSDGRRHYERENPIMFYLWRDLLLVTHDRNVYRVRDTSCNPRTGSCRGWRQRYEGSAWLTTLIKVTWLHSKVGAIKTRAGTAAMLRVLESRRWRTVGVRVCVCVLIHAIINTLMTVSTETRAWHPFPDNPTARSICRPKPRSKEDTLRLTARVSFIIIIIIAFMNWEVKLQEKTA